MPVPGASNIPEKPTPMNESTLPIAVVGMSCRLPGGCDTPQKLWDMLSRGASGWSQGAGDRFHWHAFHNPVTEHSSTFNTQGFHLLIQDLALFDARFFNISPLEAKAIDPQQRLLLEVAYESFENAGFSLEQLSGSNTGVYIAAFNSDYERMMSRDPENAPMYRVTGTGIALVSNRLSFTFNLKGPSLTLDTGCSGSLVALHQACQSLRSGEIDQALVGGANIILDPELTNSLSSAMLLGDAGRCFTFDDRAQGYGRGEGFGTVVLKSLSKALRDGDNVRAIIRNTAVNQDGKTQGITTPSRSAQEAMMYRVYTSAGLDPRETSYVEAHGTGTEVGDAIEAAAIATVFSKGRDQHNPIIVGSIKTNIGHTESTAGIAGIIKAVLMLEKGMILPNHDFEKPSSRIPFSNWPLKVPTTLLPWSFSTLRRASVNSFGYGGTNAHAVLDGADDYMKNRGLTRTHDYGRSNPPQSFRKPRINETLPWEDASGPKHGTMSTRDQRRRLFILSSHCKAGLRTTVENFLKYAKERESPDEVFFDDLTYTLSRRTLLPFRIAGSASTLTELQNMFTDASHPDKLSEPHKVLGHPSLCFVFTGQGSQWLGMGRELFGAFPVFEKSFAAAEAHLARLGADWSLRAELFKSKEDSRMGIAPRSLALTTVVQIALVDLLRSWNIRPKVVVGHSSGEIAAAYSAGGLSSEDAVSIAYYRGLQMKTFDQKLRGVKGAMLAVGLSADQALEHVEVLASGEGKVCVACINSPSSVTISGDETKILALQDKLERERIFNRRLGIDVAYHSHHMEVFYTDLVEMLGALKPRKFETSIRMISTVLGEDIEGEDLDGTYWARNSVSPVRFSEAFEKVCKWHVSGDQESEQHRLAIVEIGPHSGLAGPIKQIQRAVGSNMKYDSALIRNIDAHETVLKAAGSLITQGVAVDLDAVNWPLNDIRPRVLTDYPSYAWDHSAYWHESRLSTQYRQRQHPRHSLLGVLSPDNNPLEPKWRNYIRVADIPWVKGHAIQGQIVYPASGYVCMAIEAVRQQASLRSEPEKNVVYVLRDVNIIRTMVVPDNAQGVETIFSLRPYPQTARSSSPLWNEFRVFSVSGDGAWGEHCRGLISVQNCAIVDDVEGNRENELLEKAVQENTLGARRRCDTDLEPSKWYDYMKSISNDYTGVFKGLTSISTKPLESLCTLRIPDIRQEMPGGFDQPHCLHPVTLDLSFQAVLPALTVAGVLDASLVLNFIEELSVSGDVESACGTEFLTHAVATNYAMSKYRVDIDVQETSEPSSALSVSAKGLIYTVLSRGSITGHDGSEKDQKLCHHIEWVPDITYALPQDARKLCTARLGIYSSMNKLHRLATRARSIIKNTIASIGPKDEERMLSHHKVQLRWMRNNALKCDLNEDPGSVQHLGVEGEMLERIGANILDILKGEIHPLAVMMEGDLLHRYYCNEGIAHTNAQVAEFARLLSFKNPAMKVLEIGAGTGSATVPFLKAVSTQSGQLDCPLLDRYVFTDISTGFFDQAKKLLGPWENVVEYHKLNIEQSIDEQGFKEGSYDLLIASNVLHATSVMSDTLKNVRKLLKPGGKLCLTEITRPLPFDGLIFGTLPGWWLGADEGRIDSPLLSVDQWGILLRANGFSGIDICLPDDENEQGHQYSAIISTAVEDLRHSLIPTIEVVYSDMSGHGPEHPSNQERSYTRQTADHFIATTKHSNVLRTSINNIKPENKILIVMLEIERPFLSSCLEAEFERVKRMFSLAKGIIWITNGGAVECSEPLNAIITGLARSIRSENPLAKLITLDIDSSQETPESIAQILSTIVENVFGARSETAREHEYAVRNGLILIPRLTEDGDLNRYLTSNRSNKTPEMEPFFQDGRTLALEIGNPGLLESLVWADEMPDQALASDEVRIEIRCGGVNFRDLMIALGQLEASSKIADECSGVVLEVGSVASRSFQVGDRICAAGGGAYASSSVVKACNTHRIPDSMSFETAASIPIAYTTAYYSLVTVANLQRGESVLIHSAAGGLGQAAVMIARHLGATIYITVGNSKKKSFMTNNFDIPEQHIFSSRRTTFLRGIKRLTGGKGVDVVLNSLAADTLRESCACLAKFGRFIEVGKRDASVNARLNMEMFMRHVMFAAVDLSLIYAEKPFLFQDLLGTVVDLIHTGAVEEIRPIQVMPLGEVEGAYRLMQTGKHIGKIVLKADSNTKVKVLPPPHTRAKFREDSWYVVAGGTGGLGQVIIHWMADLGAKNIIAISRSGATGQKSLELSKEMAAVGVNLLIRHCNITDVTQVHDILDLTAGRPISGVIQGAMMLNDALMDDMSFQQWQDTTSGKIQGTQNLYNVLGGSLDFFIMLSSCVGTVGTYGQGNYAAGSTFQDAFARHLSSNGFPVRSLDLGGIASAGYVAEHSESVPYLARQGVNVVTLEKFMALLNYAVEQPLSRDVSRSQLSLGLGADQSSDSHQRSDGKFSHLYAYHSSTQGLTAKKETVNIATALRAIRTVVEAVELVCKSIMEKIADLLAIPAADLSPSRSISHYGVDSLIAVELRNWIGMHLQTEVQILELLGTGSMQQLAVTVASRCKLVPALSTAE